MESYFLLKPQPSERSCITVTKKKVLGLSTLKFFFLLCVDGCDFFSLPNRIYDTPMKIWWCNSTNYLLLQWQKRLNTKPVAPNHDISLSNTAKLPEGKPFFFFSFFHTVKFLSKECLTTELSSAALWLRLIPVIASVSHSLLLHYSK